MKTSLVPRVTPSPSTAVRPRFTFTRKHFLTLALIIYLLAWLAVIWHPFTWLCGGAFLAGQFVTYLEERFSKTPKWQLFYEVTVMHWIIFPFGMLTVYFYIYFLRNLWH